MALPTTSPNPDITAGIEATNKMPTFGRTLEQEKNTLDDADAAAEALAQRYANPNWFNVAAGFLKPQLGGFMASLGSANQALGDWQEKQRANEIPVYVARAQVGLMKAQRENKLKAQDTYSEWVNNGSKIGDAPAVKAKLLRFGATDLADATQGVLENFNTLNQSGNETITTITGLINSALDIVKDEKSTPAQKAAAMDQIAKLQPQFLALTLAGGGNAPAVPAVPAVPAAPTAPAVVPAVPAVPAAPTVVPAAPAGPTAGIPLDTGAGGVNSATALKLKTENLNAAQNYVSDLGTLAQANVAPFNALGNIYPYFNDAGVRKAMGQFDNGDVESVMKQALQGQNVSGAIKNIVDRAVPADIEAKYPGTAEKMQTLLGVAAQHQLSINNTTANPTRTTQVLEKSAVFNPITDKPDTAARKVLLAMHALQQAQYAQPIANNLFKQGLGHTDITNSPLMQKANTRWGSIHERLSRDALPDILPPGLRNYYGTQNTASPNPSGIEATLRANAAKTQ